jgi:hypothetical protein
VQLELDIRKASFFLSFFSLSLFTVFNSPGWLSQYRSAVNDTVFGIMPFYLLLIVIDIGYIPAYGAS